MSRAHELEPCPFCGGGAELDPRQGYTYMRHGVARCGEAVAVYCRDCSAQVSICREDVPDVEPEHVVEWWNRRAAPAQPAYVPLTWADKVALVSAAQVAVHTAESYDSALIALTETEVLRRAGVTR